MYRIISGKWKGKRISAPKNFEVRPTTDFAKEALFSILSNRYEFEFCSVLDLFAGIGSITLEFSSRGCEDITSVEMNYKHTGFIQKTAKDLDLDSPIHLQRADVYQWLEKNKNKKQFDIIFIDAPFETEEAKYHEMITLILENNYLKENGVLVVEHQTRLKLEHRNIMEKRKYGNITFSFIEA